MMIQQAKLARISLGRGQFDTVKVVLAFGCIYVVWGSTYLAIGLTVTTIPPLLSAGLRATAAGVILFAWSWIRGYRPRPAHWAGAATVGVFMFLVSYGFLNWGEKRVASGLAALAITLEPLFILVLGSLAARRAINRLSVAGLVLGLAGVVLLADFASRGSQLVGFGAVLISALAWSVGVVIQPRLPLPEDALPRTALPLICGGPMLLLASGLSGETHAMSASAISMTSVGALLYLVVFGSVLALTAYTWLLQRFPPALVATHAYVNPVVAVGLGWLFASEHLDARVLLACATTLAAVALIQRGEQSKSLRPQAPVFARKRRWSAIEPIANQAGTVSNCNP